MLEEREERVAGGDGRRRALRVVEGVSVMQWRNQRGRVYRGDRGVVARREAWWVEVSAGLYFR